MPEANPIEQLRRRLLELGCPVGTARKIVREAAEHLEDLRKAALSYGLTTVEAESKVAAQFGDPAILAERHVEGLRRSSWWGRHPVWGFGVATFFLMPVLLVVSLCAWILVGGLLVGLRFPGVPAEGRVFWAMVPALFLFAHGALVTAAVAAMSWTVYKVRQAALGARWLFVSCGLISLYVLLFYVQFDIAEKSSYLGITINFVSWPDRVSTAEAMIPWVLAGWFYFHDCRAVKPLQAGTIP